MDQLICASLSHTHYWYEVCQNTSRQRRRTLLPRLDNSVVRSDIDPDVFLSELLDELVDLREVVSNQRLTTIILEALPEEKHKQLKYSQ